MAVDISILVRLADGLRVPSAGWPPPYLLPRVPFTHPQRSPSWPRPIDHEQLQRSHRGLLQRIPSSFHGYRVPMVAWPRHRVHLGPCLRPFNSNNRFIWCAH